MSQVKKHSAEKHKMHRRADEPAEMSGRVKKRLPHRVPMTSYVIFIHKTIGSSNFQEINQLIT